MKYKNHPSIKAIERVLKLKDLFKFNDVDKKEVFREIVCLDASKACQDKDVPTKIIKGNADIFIDFIHPSINAAINNSGFPPFLKLANVIPVFKKGSKSTKDNYRPINIFKNVFKICEKNNVHTNRSIYGLQNSNVVLEKAVVYSDVFTALTEKWKSVVDKGIWCTTVDSLPHELLIVKLHSYGFSLSVLRLVHSYLSNRKQRTKIKITGRNFTWGTARIFRTSSI